MKKKQIPEFFARLEAGNPEPTTELNYINTYTLLVAVVLSAQATDKGVNKATESLFKKAKTPQAMVKLGLDAVHDHVKSINYHYTKAKNVMALSQMLIDEFGGQVPDNADDLQKLPGVGRKTANVILNTAFRQPTIAVDTHIFRVCNRTGLAVADTADKVADILQRVVPDEFKLHAHHWLILHGRYICVARKPKCEICPVTEFCNYYKTMVKPRS